MNTEMIQAVLEVVFKSHFVYLSPFLFLLMIVMFGDRLIDLFFEAISSGNRKRK